MGSGCSTCLGSGERDKKFNLENNIDLTPSANEAEKPINEEEEQKTKSTLIIPEKEAKPIQGAMRGYLVRRDMQNPLFDLREARSWFNIEAIYPKAEKPVAEIQSLLIGIVENKLPPLQLKRHDDVPVVAKPAVQLKDGAVYEGEWDKKGNQHGIGTLVNNDGSKLIGCFKGGLVEGLGRLIQNTGLVYEGEFKDGKLNGNGKIQREKGAKFDGEMVDGKIHGKGTEEWPDGTKYEGEYHEGSRHGIGKLIMGDGSSYVGDFSNGLMHGKGEFKWKNGNSYKGAWRKNKMHGKGVFQWNDGKKYVGHFKNDEKSGQGVMTWSDGKKYEGEWENGKQHGIGMYTFMKDNQPITKKSRWEEGTRVEWVKE